LRERNPNKCNVIAYESSQVMLYFDYTWDLNPNIMIPDPELNTDQLGWKPGDLFQVQEHNGKKFLRRVDPLVQFILEGKYHGHN